MSARDEALVAAAKRLRDLDAARAEALAAVESSHPWRHDWEAVTAALRVLSGAVEAAEHAVMVAARAPENFQSRAERVAEAERAEIVRAKGEG